MHLISQQVSGQSCLTIRVGCLTNSSGSNCQKRYCVLEQGYLSVNYSENYFRLSQRHPEVPRLTPAHHEAMELFTSLAQSDELRLDAVLEPGDIQLLNNHVSTSIVKVGCHVAHQVTHSHLEA